DGSTLLSDVPLEAGPHARGPRARGEPYRAMSPVPAGVCGGAVRRIADPPGRIMESRRAAMTPTWLDRTKQCAVCGGLVIALVAGKVTHYDPANETHAVVVMQTMYADLDDSHQDQKAFTGLETRRADVGQTTSSGPFVDTSQAMDAANQA